MAKGSPVKQYVDPKKATAAQVAEALELLNKKIDRQEKIKSGEIKGGKKWSELSEAEKDKFRKANARRLAKQNIILAKAAAAKPPITASEKEIDEYIAKKAAK